MTPEDIQRKAEEERQKQQKRQTKNDADALKEMPLPFQPLSPESRKIFNLIHPGFSRVPWVFLLAGFGIVFLFLYWGFQRETIAFLYVSLGFFGLALVFFIVRTIRKNIAYHSFRTWRVTLPFNLIGWDQVGAYKDFPNDSYWMLNTEVNIQLKNQSREMAALVSDALFLFTVEANKCFYEPDFVQHGFSGEIRKEWKMLRGDLSVKGSADRYVLGRIYLLCHVYLRGIQEKHACIDSVTVGMEGKVYEVRRVQTSND